MNRKTVSFIAICMYLFLIPISYGYAAPPIPTLISPASDAKVAGTSVTLSWSASPGATYYYLWVKRVSDGVIIYNHSVVGKTFHTLTGLPNNGSDYSWMVRAYNSTSASDWSGYRRFINGTVAPPVLLSPANNANAPGTSVNLSWNASSGATQYWLWVQRASDGVVIFNQSVGNTTSRALSLPNNGGAYLWMVRAYNSGGWSGWPPPPAARKFINGAAAIPAPPTLLSPASNAYAPGGTVNLSWSASPGATYYYLWVKRASDNVVIYNHSVVGQNYYALSLPNNGGAYFWMVRAYNSSGGSAWTAARKFNNGTAPCTSMISPSIGNFASGSGSQSVTITASSPSCTWTASGPSWVTVSPASGTGSKTVTITVNANTGAARSGSITIAGKPYTISQAGGTSSGLTTDIEKYMAMVTSVGDMSPMLDEIGTVLGEILSGDSSVVTSVPPLGTLDPENLPATITITANFGNGYTPEDSTSVYTGKVVISITNLKLSETGITANAAITATDVKRDGKLILKGGMTLGLNLGASGSNMAVTANVKFFSLQSLDYQINGGLSISAPSVNIQTGTFSPMTITFNGLKTKDFTFSSGTVKLTQNGLKYYYADFNLNTDQGLVFGRVQVDNSNEDKPVISTLFNNLTAGRYTLDINNVTMDAATCTKLPISGNIIISGGSETKTITFKNCTYTIN